MGDFVLLFAPLSPEKGRFHSSQDVLSVGPSFRYSLTAIITLAVVVAGGNGRTRHSTGTPPLTQSMGIRADAGALSSPCLIHIACVQYSTGVLFGT
jgi:hypothetical protein